MIRVYRRRRLPETHFLTVAGITMRTSDFL
jgi:hypothetical protein